MENETLLILVRVLLAMLIGGIIGLEREIKGKPAGIRTHMLVAGSSALLLFAGQEVTQQFMQIDGVGISADPTRIIQAIVVGVSFIGAGTILKSDGKQNILYLTTAASILFTAVLGVVAGLGMYMLAVSLALIAYTLLYLVGVIERKFIEQNHKD